MHSNTRSPGDRWRCSSRNRAAGLYDLDFFWGIFAPDFRASLNAIATACLRLLTFFLPPDLSVPYLYSCMTFSVFARRLVAPLVADDERFLEEVFLAIVSSMARQP
jgi:hypothetical protein